MKREFRQTAGRTCARLLAGLAVATIAAPALAGPPYLTDDPVPTDTGHWEIYGFTGGNGRGATFDDESGFDLNFGAVDGVQLTATLPLAFSRDGAGGWQSGTGDLELGLKYRLFNDRRTGVSAAIFPRIILPSSTIAGGEKARLLLPLWIGKDFANGTTLFGGGGYEINPGPGNRDFWQAGAALTHDFGRGFALGAEVFHQGRDSIGGSSKTAIGAGGVVHISGPASVLVSGGPTWADHRTGYHFYAALGLNF